jgi:hypothetical protein
MAALTHSELAARLIVEGAVGVIAGTVKGKLPIDPVILTEREASALGVPPGAGAPMLYPIGDSGVFFDVLWSRMAVWYAGADAERAPAVVEAMLKKAYPNAKIGADRDDPDMPGMHLRVFDVPLPDNKLATIEMRFANPGSMQPRFSAQIIVMGVKN